MSLENIESKFIYMISNYYKTRMQMKLVKIVLLVFDLILCALKQVDMPNVGNKCIKLEIIV